MTEGRSVRILEVAMSGTVGTSDMGPVSATICALANSFDRLGHCVTISDTRATAPRTRLSPRVRLITVPLAGRWPRLISALPAEIQRVCWWMQSIIYVAFLYRLIRRDTFDVIHVHDERLACLLAVIAPRRYVYTSHNSVWALIQDQGGTLSARQRLGAFLETLTIRRSRSTIGLADYLARQLPAEPIETIPHGIDPVSWQGLDRDSARSALGISPEEFVVVFIGRIHPQKGVDVLIDAVQKVASLLPRLRVLVIGSPGGHYGPDERPSTYATEMVERAQGAPIRFVGFVRNQSEQHLRYISAGDLAVVPSRYEPFGYVALEALAMSVPVLASRTGGLAQTVTDDVGMLVPPQDVGALAAAIQRAYESPTQLDRMRQRCRARVMEKYTRDECIRRHLSLFTIDSQAVRQSADSRPRASHAP